MTFTQKFTYQDSLNLASVVGFPCAALRLIHLSTCRTCKSVFFPSSSSSLWVNNLAFFPFPVKAFSRVGLAGRMRSFFCSLIPSRCPSGQKRVLFMTPIYTSCNIVTFSLNSFQNLPIVFELVLKICVLYLQHKLSAELVELCNNFILLDPHA